MEPPDETYPILAIVLTKFMITIHKTPRFNTFHISDEACSDLTLLIFKHNRSPEYNSKNKVKKTIKKISKNEEKKIKTEKG